MLELKIGFLVIDLQPIHLEGVAQTAIEHACEHINYVADLLRSSGHVVIHIQDIEGMDDSNKEAFRTIPEVQMKDTDIIVTKEYPNSFWKTNLEQVLIDHNIDFIVLAGFAAEHCVLFTYNGARERGFTPVLLQNGILSRHQDVIASAYRDRNLISHSVIKFMTTSK